MTRIHIPIIHLSALTTYEMTKYEVNQYFPSRTKKYSEDEMKMKMKFRFRKKQSSWNWWLSSPNLRKSQKYSEFQYLHTVVLDGKIHAENFEERLTFFSGDLDEFPVSQINSWFFFFHFIRISLYCLKFNECINRTTWTLGRKVHGNVNFKWNGKFVGENDEKNVVWRAKSEEWMVNVVK